MATIVTIDATDTITSSRADLNTNFANLNSDKIETSYLDTDTTLAANSDVKIPSQKAVKTYVDAGGNVNASETSKGIVEEATDAEVTAGTATGATGAKLIITPTKLATRLGSVFKFGGTGADGALALTSGATNIDLGNAAVVIKNYTSISITGTGSLTFTNPHTNGTIIILKSQGNVTLTSSTAPMINAVGKGAAGGAAVSGSSTSGGPGSIGQGQLFFTNFGGAGIQAGGDGAGGVLPTVIKPSGTIYTPKNLNFVPGAGGGSANALTSGTVPAGGSGGGCLLIECAGAWNFTTASGISVAGATPANSSGTNAGGSGGGGGGCFTALYNTLTASSGTVVVTGGVGGAGVGADGRSGGGGASTINAGTAGTRTTPGGNGGDGFSIIQSNTEFV